MSSCNLYRRDILFKASREIEKQFAKGSQTVATPPNYLVSKNDMLEFIIFTNKGEAIIDPTSEFMRQINSTTNNGSGKSGGARYLIQGDGCADLPILGHVKLDSLTLHQIDSLLSVKYGQYYQDVFVLSKISNRKIFVLGIGSGGALGAGMNQMMGGGGGMSTGRAQIVDLESENVTLLEVLAKAGGVGRYSYANRVKVIRGNLKNPTIFTVDLTKWDSFQKSNLIMQPNDIVYVEPLRRGFIEFFSDLTGITSILTTVLSVYLITRL